MKSSLKFTAIALLLGGVLHVQNLNAAASDGVDYGSAINPFAEKVRAIFASPGTPKEFATSIETLSRTPSNTNQEKRLLLNTLVSEVVKSERSLMFFEEAFAEDSKAKVFMAACIAAKQGRISGDITIRGLREELDNLTSKLERSTGDTINLRDQLNELIERVYQVYQTLESAAVRAFLPLTGPSVITPVEELAAYTVVASKPSTLPLAEQVYLLKVREHLGNPEKLEVSLSTQLDTLMKSVRNIASDVFTPESFSRAAFLVDVIPQVRGIVPIIGGYVQSISAQMDEINKEIRTHNTMFWTATPSPAQALELRELEARRNLGYAIFDALFGSMVKPTTIPGAVNDQSIANALASKVQTLHTTLSTTELSKKLIVKDDGSIVTINNDDFSTRIDPNSVPMLSMRTETTHFLKQVIGAQTLLQTTFAKSALVGFSELAQAKASLLPPPAPVAAEVVGLPIKTSTGTASMDDSFHDDEDGLVDPTTDSVTKEEAIV